ncbi:MAG: DUF2141 domain-containing protein [Armatimonadota bacterium]
MTDIRLKTFEKALPYTITLPGGLSPTKSLQIIREEDARKMDLRGDSAVAIIRDEHPKAIFPEIVQDICRRFPIASEFNTGMRLPQLSKATGVVELDGVPLKGGNVLVSVYASGEGWLKDTTKAVLTVVHPATDGNRILIDQLPTGKCYAVGVHYDVNGNGKLDTRLGLPDEPFAVSNNASGKMGPPSFQASAFLITATSPVWHRQMTLKKINIPRFRI